MPYSAIIAEYDPFHTGHAYHIKATKNAGADGIAVILSSNFTQRGYPAIVPREIRAEAALRNGADLVVELPAPWSCASAEVFARGAVSIVDGLGIFDTLSFGSSAESTGEIAALADVTSSEQFTQAVTERLSDGVSYPRAVSEALESMPQASGICGLSGDANAVLACEYVRALENSGSSVKPMNIKRIGASHGDTLPRGGFASASWLRNIIYKSYNANKELYGLYTIKDYTDSSTFDLLISACESGKFPVDKDRFGLSALTVLRTLSAEDIGKVFGASEGLENRIYRAVRESVSFIGAADSAKTKRFTHSRIRRVMLSAYLGADAALYNENVPYARVLAVNEKGCEMLRKAKTKSTIRIITRIPQMSELSEFARKVFEFNSKAEDLYNLCLPTPRECGTYYTSKIIKLLP